ncbi:coronin-2B-like [Coccinella septempunctata]|uniref:coronin-2B-like n=1 Tax=Coccinella septempunctata TaxID=41139 RepID=UPI001D06881B|nr:coronin-2B-like [Coccinella septempunctata]XP_044761762.1 coronin-2B-like [Coccinella septempunctata]XP_044761763.1 coronin-2B-like [Coccinella septempunctata]
MTNSQVWFRGVRSSKFRHVYGEPAKRDKCYDNVNVTKNAHDSQFCAVNPKFIAIVTEVAGGGAFVVIPIDCTGRLDFNASKVTGHKGPVLDIKWNPFNDNVIASASDDCTIKLWHIPDSGLSHHLTDWLVELQGHKRRVSYIDWHPTAENILFSVGFDHMIIVWNIEKGEAVNVIDCHPDVIYSMTINRDGSLIATTCKDKQLRVIEPRSGIVKSAGFCHMGSKASKVTFLGTSGRLLTTGFSRHSDRQYAVWDQNDLGKELFSDTVDSSSGVVFPFYDYDTNVVFLAGRGDGNIRYYEVTDEYPYVHFLNQFLSGSPQRGLGVMPKRGLNTSICEIYRFYKLHATKGICEPVSMIVPRKSDQFHEDIYPHTASSKPALTAQEWIRGCNAMPVLVSMKTGDNIQHQFPKKQKLTSAIIEPPAMNNNRKKFAFLSTETTPDYRPKDLLNEKNLKTNTNQTTKFQELQQIFGHVEVTNEIPLIKDITNNAENITENDLKAAYKQLSDEVRKMRKIISQKDRRIKELEETVKKLQSNKNQN